MGLQPMKAVVALAAMMLLLSTTSEAQVKRQWIGVITASVGVAVMTIGSNQCEVRGEPAWGAYDDRGSNPYEIEVYDWACRNGKVVAVAEEFGHQRSTGRGFSLPRTYSGGRRHSRAMVGLASASRFNWPTVYVGLGLTVIGTTLALIPSKGTQVRVTKGGARVSQTLSW